MAEIRIHGDEHEHKLLVKNKTMEPYTVVRDNGKAQYLMHNHVNVNIGRVLFFSHAAKAINEFIEDEIVYANQ